MKKGTSLPPWLTVSSAGRFVRGLASKPMFAYEGREVPEMKRMRSTSPPEADQPQAEAAL